MKVKIMNSHLKGFILGLTVLPVTFTLCAQTQISVKYGQTFQVIDGFGASDAWTFNPMINKWEAEGKQADIESLADTLFSAETGIGLSAWRFNIGAGSAEQGNNSLISLDNLGKPYRRAELLQPSPGAPIDNTKQLGQIRFLQEAHERGVQNFVAFTNSPPVWATKNGLAHPNNGTGVDSTNLDPDMTDEYATFLVDVLTYLRSEDVNVPVNYISPINEPTWEWQGKSQEANRYNMSDVVSVYNELFSALAGAELTDKVEIDAGEVVEYTAALSDSYYKDFTNGSSNYTSGMNGKGLGLYKNYIDELLGNETIRTKISNKISLHGYHSDAWSDRMGTLRNLVLENVKAASPEAKIWMSEFSILGGTGDVRNFEGNGWNVNDMDYAMHIAKVIHRDLTRLNVSAWHWWLGVTPYNYKDGLIKVNSELDADSIRTSKILWTLGHYSRFIRPDYVRIGLANVDNLNGVMASAYKSPDGNKIVIVAANASTSAETLSFDLADLPQGKMVSSFSTYITNAENDLVLKTPTLISSDYSLPAKSIVSFVADIVDVDTAPVVSFSQDKTLVEEGGTVSFLSLTSNSPETFEWLFEGGTPETSSEAAPEVMYEHSGTFNVSLTATNAFGSDTKTLTDVVNVVVEDPENCSSSGYLNIETWSNLSDTGDYDYDSSVASIPLQSTSQASTIDMFEIQADSGDNYATRIRGYLCAPLTGEYTFWIASDNHGELWLSSDESQSNTSRIAHSNDWNNYQEWDKYESQKSAPIHLIAGQKYYVETLHKEHNGGDNLSVGWKLPDGTFERPILDNRISPFIAEEDPTPLPTPDPKAEDSSSSGGGSLSIFMLFIIALFKQRHMFTRNRS
ncbi:glycoside hydrolase [Thalassotalea nanhaiensis]|uniref:Glycoside hydrolase n=1 Tax=Thalassotalea nanhaiensis TaxID=3065648 RepID=A0ABY9TGG9_9GAMM|nr:glycoside hydrolase [Colwelliaceae bacterium SQ345]